MTADTRRRRGRVGAVAITIALAVAGAAPGASAASAEDWGTAFCKAAPKVSDALGATIETETALTEALTAAMQSPGSDVSTEIADYDADLKKAAKLAKKAAKALKQAGAPDIKNGEELQSEGVKAYRTAASEIGKARGALADIDPTDPNSALDPLFELADHLGNASSAITDFALDVLTPAAEKNTDLAKGIASC